MANPLDVLMGSTIDFGSVSSKKLLKNLFGPGVTANAVLSMFANPELLNFFATSANAGLNPYEELQKFTVGFEDVGGKKAIKNAPAGQYIKIGKGKFVDVGGVTTAAPEYAAKQEAFKMEQAAASLAKIKATPAFSTIAAMSEGNFSSDYMKAYDKWADPMLSAKLGNVGVKGNLADPKMAAAPIVEASQAKAQYLTDKQLEAEEYLKAAAGYPGALSYAPAGLGGPTSPGQFVAPFSNLGQFSTQLASQLGQFNAQGGFQETQAKQAAFSDFFGTLVGAGAGMYGMNQQQAGLDKILGSMGGGGGGGMNMQSLMMLMSMFCVVAEELFGVDDPRTHAARYYVTTHENDFARAYSKHGRLWVERVRTDPELREIAYDMWSDLARAGQRELDRLGSV